MESGIDTILSVFFLHFLVFFQRSFGLDFLHISAQSYPHRFEDVSRKWRQSRILLQQDPVRLVLWKQGRDPALMIEPDFDRSPAVVDLASPKFAPNQMRRMNGKNAGGATSMTRNQLQPSGRSHPVADGLTEESIQLMSRAISQNTRTAYKRAYRAFNVFREDRPVSDPLICEWLREMDSRGLAPSTIQLMLAGVVWAYRQQGVLVDTTRSSLVMKGIKRGDDAQQRGRGQQRGIRRAEVELIRHKLNTGDLRDRGTDVGWTPSRVRTDPPVRPRHPVCGARWNGADQPKTVQVRPDRRGSHRLFGKAGCGRCKGVRPGGKDPAGRSTHPGDQPGREPDGPRHDHPGTECHGQATGERAPGDCRGREFAFVPRWHRPEPGIQGVRAGGTAECGTVEVSRYVGTIYPKPGCRARRRGKTALPLTGFARAHFACAVPGYANERQTSPDSNYRGEKPANRPA